MVYLYIMINFFYLFYSLLKHQQTIKHHANLESGSSYAKLQASPAVANAYFREEWRNVYPWVTVDPSGMLST